jgi:hypothetical protein
MKNLRTTLSPERFIKIISGAVVPREGKLSAISESRRGEIVRPKDVSTRRRYVKSTLPKSILQRILVAKIKLQHAKLSVARRGDAIVFPRDVSES